METEINELNGNNIVVKENVYITKNTFSDHGNEIEEIISKKLPFIVRWGTVFFSILLLFLFLICWFIRYPDIIQAPAKLTSINAPKPVINLINGKLIKLNVEENEQVRTGSILGLIESTANHNEVLKLASDVDSMQKLLNNNITEKIPFIFQNHYAQLGELQTSYQILFQAFLTFKNYLSNGFYIAKKNMLAKDMDHLKHLHTTLLDQKYLQEQDLALTQKTMEANESLKKDEVISDLDYRTEQSKLISKKMTLPQINATIINNETQQNDKQKEIAELENNINQQKVIFEQALSTFKSQLEDWKKKYLLVAPMSGKVAFASFIQENQQLQANQTICYINPEKAEYFAQITIPQSNFGKVSIGQLVLLKFNSYPYPEYGFVKGKIAFISHIPTDSGYLAKVILTNGLNTTYQKQVQYRDGLTANAEIITKDLRLLQRFYFTIIQQIKR